MPDRSSVPCPHILRWTGTLPNGVEWRKCQYCRLLEILTPDGWQRPKKKRERPAKESTASIADFLK